jgi:hemerythrin-like domain-containing protein
MDVQRRRLLRLLGTGALVSAVAPHETAAETTPGEDLMQEHGVLERLLLIYSEIAHRIELGPRVNLGLAASAALIVQRFVEDYHERAEERFVLSTLEGHGTLTPLIRLLKLQHTRGRVVTQQIVALSASRRPDVRLARALRSFERMYRPHAAREDTVVFPAFRALLGRDAYRVLGERMEENERHQLGNDGFARTVDDVAKLEGALHIGDLAQFTP